MCAPGERHELGLMTLAVALRNDGWQVVYVGADTPFADAAELAHRVSAPFLGVSIALRERAAELAGALARTRVPEGVELVIGGAAASTAVALQLGARYVDGGLVRAVRALRRLAQ
jgi:methanogenic corrinoid protein MtbC1